QLLGTRGDGAGDGKHSRQVAILDEVMLGQPHGVEAERFQAHDLVQQTAVQLGPRASPGDRVAEVVQHPELHRADYTGPRLCRTRTCAPFSPTTNATPRRKCGGSTTRSMSSTPSRRGSSRRSAAG